MSNSEFKILLDSKDILAQLSNFLREDITQIQIYGHNFALHATHLLHNSPGKSQLCNSSLSFQIFSLLSDYARTSKNKPTGFIKIHSSQSLNEENILKRINKEDQVQDSYFVPKSGYKIEVFLSTEKLDIFVNFLKKFIEKLPHKPQKFTSLSQIVDTFFITTDHHEQFNTLNHCLDHLKAKIIKKANFLSTQEGHNLQESIEKTFENLKNKIKTIHKSNNLQLWKNTLSFFTQVAPALCDSSKELTPSSYRDIYKASSLFYSSNIQWLNQEFTYSMPLFGILASDLAPALILLSKEDLKEEIILQTKNDLYFLDCSNFDLFEQNHPHYFHLSYAISGILPQDKSSPKSIHKYLEFFSKINTNKISIFCSPYFNSHKLTNFIKHAEDQSKTQDPKNAKNYLILSECPLKSNAGLNQGLLEELGQTISNPQSSHYDQYEIKTNSQDNQPLILSLSPFAFVSKERILSFPTPIPNTNLFFGNDREKGGLYIQSFFQEESFDDFLKKEEQIYKQELQRIENFAQSLCQQGSSHHTCQILELLALALLLRSIQESYQNIKLQDRFINIGNDKIVFFTQDTYFNPSHKQGINETYYNKDASNLITLSLLGHDKNILSLTSLVDGFSSDLQLDKQQLYKHLIQIVQKETELKDSEQEYGEIFLGFLEVFIDIFPFKFCLQDSKTLAPKLLQAMLKSSYAKEMVMQFDLIFKIKDLCTTTSEHTQRFYPLLSKKAQNYQKLFLHPHFDLNHAITNLLNEIMTEIPNTFKDVSISYALPEQNQQATFFSTIFWVSMHSFFLSFAPSLNKEFENQRAKYQSLMRIRFTYSKSVPLAVEHEEGIYYPMAINQTSLAFSFCNFILGGRLCSGGMGEIDCSFHVLQSRANMQALESNALKNAQKFHIYLLFKLLCLDELRNTSGDQNIEDEEFFAQNHFNQSLQNYILDTDNHLHKAIYQSYEGGGAEMGGNGQGSAIQSYQIIIKYLSEIEQNIPDSTQDNQINPKKHREAMKALENIGKHNLRALYVGVKNVCKDRKNQKNNKEIKSSRPKKIGRLATTIIAKDGLWIG